MWRAAAGSDAGRAEAPEAPTQPMARALATTDVTMVRDETRIAPRRFEGRDCCTPGPILYIGEYRPDRTAHPWAEQIIWDLSDQSLGDPIGLVRQRVICPPSITICPSLLERAGMGVGATDIITILFTDLVRSTDALARLGEERAEELRHTHFGLLREAVAQHRAPR